MRKSIKDLVGIVSRTLPIEDPIYEFGAYQVEGQEGFADLRVLFPGKTYIGCDMRSGPGVDRILDLHKLGLADNSIATVLMLDTLEHVEFPYLAMQEAHRVIAPGGFVLISSVMNFPIHSHPYDYWRFTPSAFKSLLSPFKNSLVEFAGEEDFPHTVIGLGFKGDLPDMQHFHSELQIWKKYNSTLRGKAAIRQLIPPVVMDLYDKAVGKK